MVSDGCEGECEREWCEVIGEWGARVVWVRGGGCKSERGREDKNGGDECVRVFEG